MSRRQRLPKQRSADWVKLAVHCERARKDLRRLMAHFAGREGTSVDVNMVHNLAGSAIWELSDGLKRNT